jgi:hypothetical protein
MFVSPSKTVVNISERPLNLIIFDEVSNIYEIIWNLTGY